MAVGQTKLEVCNLALDIIREPPAQSLTDTSAPLRWVLRNYDHTVDVALRSYKWNFAKRRAKLSRDGTDPEFEWAYRYKLPNDCLRILSVAEYGGRLDGRSRRAVLDVPHEIVGNYIETDYAAPLAIKYILRITNPGEWDPLFVEIVRCSLAQGLANKFTSKNKFLELATGMLNRAVAKAEEIDTFEGSPEPTEQDDIIRARY